MQQPQPKHRMNHKKQPRYDALRAFVGILAVIVFAILMYYLVVYLRKTSDTVKEQSFAESEAGRIGDTSISMEEFMLYSVDVRNGYELQYGDDIWEEKTQNALGEEVTFETLAKEDTFEEIRLIKAMCKKAADEGLELTDEELTVLNENANDYFEALFANNATSPGMTIALIKQYYSDQYMANKVYDKYKETLDQSEDDDYNAFWSKIIEAYYPDFNYATDINWELVDTISYGTADDNTNQITGGNE